MIKRICTVLITTSVAMLSLHAGAGGTELGLPVADAKSQGMSAEKLAAIPEKIQPYIDQGKLAGAITAVARNGKIVHFEAMGSMDTERNKPMQSDTIFRLYSMTKPVTGTAIMMLVDEGKLSLQDPVSKYIPEFAMTKVFVKEEAGKLITEPVKSPLTIQHLMMHTSGLPYPSNAHPVSRAYVKEGVNSGGHSGLTLEEFAKKVASVPLMYQPGTEWKYGVSMDVLGRIVEVASGQRFGTFLRERIFSPLGMKDSGFQVQSSEVERFAANYGRTDDGKRLIDDPVKSRYLTAPSQESGGGGMVGTAADYLRFAQMLLNEGELDGVRIISKASAREMTTNQMDPKLGTAPLKFIPGINMEGVGFGYCGAAVMDGVEQTLFGPAGVYSWGGAASTDFWIDRHQKIVGVVLTQMMPTNSYPTRRILMTSTYEAIEE